MSLWSFIKSEKTIHFPHRRAFQRASFCACQKGAYTLEAAVVIPLLAAYLVMILYFFTVLEIQFVVEEALVFAGRKTAIEGSVVDSEEVLFLSAEGYLLYALKDEPIIEHIVKNGALGISLWKSEVHGDEIVLRADYEVLLPVSIFEIGRIDLSSKKSFRKWVGNVSSEIYEDVVFVTPTGEVYHKSAGCRSLSLSIQEGRLEDVIWLRGKNGQKYDECMRCVWSDIDNERIYYTDYGTLYHKDLACSSLKRTILKIHLDEVGGRRPCSFCYEL